MDVVLLVAVGFGILVVGGIVFWVLARRTSSGGQSARPSKGVERMGYGEERWERELALWRGTRRRLEIQAKHQSPPSEVLQRQLEEAEARIAEAERHLNGKKPTV